MTPLLLLALLGPAAAGEPVELGVHGNVKTFVLGVVTPYRWYEPDAASYEAWAAAGYDRDEVDHLLGVATPPAGSGTVSGRLVFAAEGGPLRLELHEALALGSTLSSTSVAGFGTGVGADAPALVALGGRSDWGGSLEASHRLDRATLSLSLPSVQLTLGRQPVSFGRGQVFTPMDLVNPFHPATIDTEYKPGVDALRVELYPGLVGKVDLVAAWAGDPVAGAGHHPPDLPEDLVFATAGHATVGVTDLALFAGAVRGEPVFGLGAEGGLGAVSLHAEATLTLPAGEDPFVRAVAGAGGRPTSTTSLSGELYVQSFGAAEPEGYLAVAASERFQRGEVWQMGRLYGALSVGQELTPLVAVNGAVISNLLDPSALVVAGGSWSVADEADVLFGAYAGLGARPDTLELDWPVGVTAPAGLDADALAGSVRSEFGVYPVMGYVQVRTYF